MKTTILLLLASFFFSAHAFATSLAPPSYKVLYDAVKTANDRTGFAGKKLGGWEIIKEARTAGEKLTTGNDYLKEYDANLTDLMALGHKVKVLVRATDKEVSFRFQGQGVMFEGSTKRTVTLIKGILKDSKHNSKNFSITQGPEDHTVDFTLTVRSTLLGGSAEELEEAHLIVKSFLTLIMIQAVSIKHGFPLPK